MGTFLNKVAKDILLKNDNIGDLVFVLPNQRSGIYLKKHLKNYLNKTSFFPDIVTFDNLAEQISGIPKITAVSLVFEFYESYKQVNIGKKVDSFDVFTNWAITLLSDFNEIDAYLIDPKTIFSTLKDINKIQNWDPTTELTQNYLNFLQDLDAYYHILYNNLLSKQRGYQGMILKEALMSLNTFLENTNKHYVFAGFNHLKTSESQIIQEILEADKASIYWDISEEMINSKNQAGIFIRKYQQEWPYFSRNKMNWLTKTKIDPKKIEIVGIPKNVGMIKYAGELINDSVNTSNTAFVLADQNLLPIALNSLPNKVDNVNITMGLDLKNFPISDLIRSIFELHTHVTNQKTYYYKMALKVLEHPIVLTQFKQASRIIKNLKKGNKVFVSYQEIKFLFKSSEKENFTPLLHLFKSVDANFSTLINAINTLINHLKDNLDGIEKEVLFKHYKLNQQLLLLDREYLVFNQNSLGSTPLKTAYQIYKKLLFNERLSFIGEPLQGLQLMGFLETQALSFDHVILSSVNEGILPKSKRTNSFIPFDLRKELGLLTYREENAIVSYHFYRLIHASNHISILYDNETDTFGGGEKSQFITQLLWKHPEIKQKQISSLVQSDSLQSHLVVKTPQIIERLTEIVKKGISPSALTSYVYNQFLFYQQRVLGINELEEVEETIADNTMGTVIHETLENLYKPFVGKVLNVDLLKSLLIKTRAQVKIEFANNYKNGQFDQGKNRLAYEVIVKFVKRFITNEIQDVKEGKIIKIIALELSLSAEISLNLFDFPIRFRGFVDRIDEIDGLIRIIDYKSGKVESSQLRVKDYALFITDYKYAKAFQVLLYALMFSKHKLFDSSKKLQAGIISFKNLNAGFLPVNFAPPRAKAETFITPLHLEEFIQMLEDLLVQIFDVERPFIEE